MKKIVTHPMFSGSAVMVGGSLGVNAINYFYHLIMGRILGPVDYGILATLFSIIYIVSIVPISGSFAIVKFISSAKTRQERAGIYLKIKKLLFYIATPTSLVIILLSPVVAKFLHIKSVFSILLIGPVLFFSLVTLVNQATLQGLLSFSGVVIPNLTSSMGKLVLGVVFVLLGWSVLGAMGAVLLGVAFAYLVSIKLVGRRFESQKIKLFSLGKFIKFAFPVLVQALAFTSIFTVDLILVKHFLSPLEAGLYAALSTLGKIIYFAAQPVTAVMFPVISGKRARGEKYRNVFFLSFFLTAVLSVIIVSFYFLFPNIAIGMLYGKEYLSAASELVWMGVFISTYTICYLIVNFVLSIGRTKIVLLPLLCSAIQIVAIMKWHSSILKVIQVSLVSIVLLFVGLLIYLIYNQVKLSYAKK